MTTTKSIWLVTNSASGSNDQAAWDELEHHCEGAGLCIGRNIRFPVEPLPRAAELREHEVELVAVFAGDGTTSALVTSLYGWEGAILVLPGGTMNLLYQRLHGGRTMQQAIAAMAAGDVRRHRPGIIRSSRGDALSGLLAGPGTEWNEVREAIRDVDPVGMAKGAAQAIDRSVAGPTIACTNPALGRVEGYSLIMITPEDEGMALRGYHSETIEDYFAQGLALLKRDFRDGPHDKLGEVITVEIESAAGEPIGLLVDGEPAEGSRRERFELARCEVDLLATRFDD